MTPRIPGYHFQPHIQPTIRPIVDLRPIWEKPIDPPYMPPNPYENPLVYKSAWEPKPTHPDYPYLPNYIPPKDPFIG